MVSGHLRGRDPETVIDEVSAPSRLNFRGGCGDCLARRDGRLGLWCIGFDRRDLDELVDGRFFYEMFLLVADLG